MCRWSPSSIPLQTSDAADPAGRFLDDTGRDLSPLKSSEKEIAQIPITEGELSDIYTDSLAWAEKAAAIDHKRPLATH